MLFSESGKGSFFVVLLECTGLERFYIHYSPNVYIALSLSNDCALSPLAEVATVVARCDDVAGCRGASAVSISARGMSQIIVEAKLFWSIL